MKSIEEVLGVSSANARVLLCHNFVSQDVFVSDEKDIAAMCAAQDKLLIATSKMTIQVRDLNSKGQALMSFPTIDKVVMMDYCKTGNFVVTLEQELLTKSVDTFHVRAYFNWWNEVSNQTPNIRCAGSLPSQMSTSNRLEVVELPLGSKFASGIACCRQSGTTGVVLRDCIKIFSLRSSYDDDKKCEYKDFEYLMDIRVAFSPTRVYVCEDHIACCSEREVHIFKICLEVKQQHLEIAPLAPDIQKKPRQNSPPDSSAVVDDPYIVQWKFDSEEDLEWGNAKWEGELKSVLHPCSFPIALELASSDLDGRRQCIDDIILGPKMNPPLTCKVSITVNPNTELLSSFDNVRAVTLLYRKFNSLEGKKSVSSFHWVPYYFDDDSEVSMPDPLTAALSWLPKPPASVLCSPMCSKLHALACFISCADHGYFYSLNDPTTLRCIYKYSSEVKSVALDECFLHALTNTGLETYVTPLPCEPLSPAGTSKEEVTQEKTALMIGLRPFLALGTLLMSDHHLVLASSFDSCSNLDLAEQSSSTLYSLLKPSMSQLFYDLQEAAAIYKTEERLAYISALKEGFLILKVQILLQGKSRSNSELLAAYSDSCCVLGDLCLKSDIESETEQAALYYSLSEQTPETVIRRMLLFKGQMKMHCLTKGVMQYVKLVLCSQCPSSKGTIRSLSPATADAVLDIFSDECPEALYRLILCSGIPTFRSEKAMGLLKRKLTSKRQSQGYAADSLAIVHLLLQNGNAETAQNILKTLSKEFLVPILLDLHELVHSDQKLTPLGQLIKTSRPDVYFSTLVHLKNAGTMSPEEIVLVLQHSSPQAELHGVPLLKEFLESVLSSKRTNAQVYPHLLVMLVKVYLGRISPTEGISPQRAAALVHAKPASLFGCRPAWLLELPPFCGRAVTKTCSLYSTSMNLSECCLCCNCWDDLLRLQSLLCSRLPTASARSQVLELLEATPLLGSDNYLSLKVLCLPGTEAVSLLLNLYPSSVLGYMEDKFSEEREEWLSLYRAVDKKLAAQPSSNGGSVAVYSKVMAGVLGYLSIVLTPEELVSLLPPGKQEYMNHVRQCMEKYQAKLLREKIIALGTELKEMM